MKGMSISARVAAAAFEKGPNAVEHALWLLVKVSQNSPVTCLLSDDGLEQRSCIDRPVAKRNTVPEQFSRFLFKG